MKKNLQKILPVLLSMVLLLQFIAVPVFAESTESNISPIVQSEESIQDSEIIPETTESTSEFSPQDSEDASIETTLPVAAEPLPTTPEKQETQSTTISTVTISEALTMGNNGQSVMVQGTVIYATDTYAIMEDDTGGIAVTFDRQTFLTPGDCITATVQLDGTFPVLSWEVTGSTALPITEASLSSAPENRHILLNHVTIEDGFLTQNGASLALATSIPQDVLPGDLVTVSGVVIQGQFYADEICKVSLATAADTEWNTWYPVDYSAIHSGDIVVITLTDGDNTWALDIEEESIAAIPVRFSVETMECPAATATWTVTKSENTLAFQGDSGWLSSDNTSGGLKLIISSEPQWKIEDTYLLHSITNRYLTISQDTQWQMLLDHQSEASDQILSFWKETPTSDQDENSENGELQPYFGLLHAHSTISDGTASVTEMFEAASQVEGLDFFAVTDHSDSLENANSGSIDINGAQISSEWKAGKEAAAAVTSDTFLGLFGYEISWRDDHMLGHITTLGTPGWTTWEQAATLENYYDTLSRVPGSISQFNHPGSALGNFHNFSNYQTQYDNVMHLIEVGDQGSLDGYEYYVKALDNGWHLAPSCNQNNRDSAINISGSRTAVLCEQLTEESLFQAIRDHRVYATQDADLSIVYNLNGSLMGSTLHETETLQAEITISDPTDSSIGLVEVIADGGTVVASQTVNTAKGTLSLSIPGGYHYYFLRITQPDQQQAVTAPVWVEDFSNIQIDSFLSDIEKPEQGQSVTLTLSLSNQETLDFTIDSIRVFAEDTLIHQVSAPGSVSSADKDTYSFPFTWDQEGIVHLRAEVTGRIGGITRTIENTLSLTFGPKKESIDCSPISDVRSGSFGTIYKIKGYITAGTANAYTTFTDTLYLQDNSGGIAIAGIFPEGIQIGCPMEVVGVLKDSGNQLLLEVTDYTLLSEEYYRFVPRTLAAKLAMNYSVHGGELLQVEGTVVSVIKTSDGKGLNRIVVKDMLGDQAVIFIESNIKSGSTGINKLASIIEPGKIVRAMGICYLDDSGECVLRVRNCDEVVYIPPRADPSNPKTGDWLAAFLSYWG